MGKIYVKPNINYVSQQIFNEQMQTIEMTCVKISLSNKIDKVKLELVCHIK
jgi:hypothetical protein